MPQFTGIQVFIQPAEIISVYESDRFADIKWLGMEGTRPGVVIVNNPGNTSMPKPGDRGLVIGTGNYFYFIGKIEYGYVNKVNGNYTNPDTGKVQTSKLVKGGETYLTNTDTKSWLNLPNTGDMELLNGYTEGFDYIANLRISKLLGKTVGMFANGINFLVGTAIRNVPGKGDQPIAGSSSGKALEALLQIAYMGAQSVRFHLGEIMDLVSGASPELSAWGARLKAILEVTAGAAPLGSLKIDESGNLEVKSTTGDTHVIASVGAIKIEATAGTVTVQSPLGRLKITQTGSVSLEAGESLTLGNPAGAEPAILGDTFNTALGTFLGIAAQGSSVSDLPAPTATAYCKALGGAATALIALMETWLSTQVTVGKIPGPPIL
jgi:hypothetical protein